MNVAQYTIQHLSLSSWVGIGKANASVRNVKPSHPVRKPGLDILRPVRRWLDAVEVREPELAHRLCSLIPAQCPFERDVKLLGRTLFHIPPLCKLNPLYDEVVGLRFRALCYLADECGEDITPYC